MLPSKHSLLEPKFIRATRHPYSNTRTHSLDEYSIVVSLRRGRLTSRRREPTSTWSKHIDIYIKVINVICQKWFWCSSSSAANRAAQCGGKKVVAASCLCCLCSFGSCCCFRRTWMFSSKTHTGTATFYLSSERA